MVLDFGDLSNVLTKYVHDVYDHGFIVYKEDNDMLVALDIDANKPAPRSGYGWKVIIVSWTPTAENMAHAIFEDLWNHVMDMDSEGRVQLYSIEVYETPKSRAAYVGGV
jgi:6-pyruvoyltetrahydropterin/6-carboxytetrahydropterin synthase